MAKVKQPLPESKQVKDLTYTEHKNKNDGSTHNVRFKKVKPKKK